jgi:glutaredoxin-like protein NrdH
VEEKMIKLYAVSTCDHCRTVKKMLQMESFAFDYVDVDLLIGKQKKDMIEEVKLYNKRCSFPTMVVGEQVIVGYRENEIKEALGI